MQKNLVSFTHQSIKGRWKVWLDPLCRSSSGRQWSKVIGGKLMKPEVGTHDWLPARWKINLLSQMWRFQPNINQNYTSGSSTPPMFSPVKWSLVLDLFNNFPITSASNNLIWWKVSSAKLWATFPPPTGDPDKYFQYVLLGLFLSFLV